MVAMSEFLSDFDTVWKAYPRKTAKAVARKAWAKLRPDVALVQKMLDAIAWQVKQPQWAKDGGLYVPHFSTWLNQERYDDEPCHVPQERRNDRLAGLREFIDG